MPASRRAEVESVFEQALERPMAVRAGWVAQRCASDPRLRAEVEAMLGAHARSEGILDRGVAPLAASLLAEHPAERHIGPYRVMRELGRGGMGVVYLAERVDGQYRREVAIKLLRSSPDGDELHRRFVAERQILASLSHPNIAQLLDGGTTDGQLPYLVMEYVDGVPITEYCDRNALDVPARLRLFVDVCRAVHAAHQNLVIHRDIKPGNILVTATGQVKLLDFGIAKLLNPAFAGLDVPHTATALRVMTPDYASPEQVRGESLTTASDVYALGVVLYELVAGRRPYRIRTAALRELQELVCEREPDRPSTQVTRVPMPDDDETPTPHAIAAARGTTFERLRRQLDGDVDAIVMNALRKEPRRRYGSAELLAEDIERHLAGHPVVARPAGRAYFIAKFLRRHRAAAIAGALAALSLVAGTAVALDQAAAARRERDRAATALASAEEALRESEDMTGFLVGLFDANTPTTPGARSGTTDEILGRGEAQIERLASQPLVQARMLDGMGRIYRNAGRYAESRLAFERSLAVLRTRGDAEVPEAANTMVRLADVLRSLGSYAEAESLSRHALRIRQRALGPNDVGVAEALEMLSMLAVYRGDLAAAESLAQRAVVSRRAAIGADDPRNGPGLVVLATQLRRRGFNDAGEEKLREVIALYERAGGPTNPALVPVLQRLGEARVDDHADLAGATPLFARAYAIALKELGESHPQTAYALGSVAVHQSRLGNQAAAAALMLRSIAVLERTLGANHPSVADAYTELTRIYIREGRLADAERSQRAVMRIYGEAFGRNHSAYGSALSGLGDVYLASGRLTEAESTYRRAIDIRRRALGGETGAIAVIVTSLGDVRLRRGDLAGADSLYQRALQIVLAQSSVAHRDARMIFGRLAALRERQGRGAEAAAYRERTVVR